MRTSVMTVLGHFCLEHRGGCCVLHDGIYIFSDNICDIRLPDGFWLNLTIVFFEMEASVKLNVMYSYLIRRS